VKLSETVLRVASTLLGGVCLLAPVAPASAAAPQIEIGPARSLASPTAQSVQITLSAAGRKVIFNETPVQHGRRFAGKLLPVPDLAGLPAGGLEPLILRRCGEQNLDPRLVRAVIQVESGYNHRARSNKGAIGLMQLMPDTASELAVRDPYDVDQNLRGGTTYLRQMIDTFAGRIELALAAYNAGPGAVQKHRGIPPYPDTVDYVQRVMALYRGEGGPLAAAAVYRPGRRPAPYITRGPNGRLLVTTSLSAFN
jgi:soluble lytic murein transglycosylase-like protein